MYNERGAEYEQGTGHERYELRLERLSAHDLLDIVSTFSRLSSDAFVVFNEAFCVVYSNTEAERLFGCAPYALEGADIRELVAAPGQTSLYGEPRLSFELDGPSLGEIHSFDGSAPRPVVLRCGKTATETPLYVLSLRLDSAVEAFAQERGRLVDELYEANRRLSGILQIVLDTINSAKIDDLFTRVAEELHDFVDADEVLLYIIDGDDFQLMGNTGSMSDERLPKTLPPDSSFVRLATSGHGALQLRLLPPSREALRGSHGTMRELISERTSEVFEVEAWALPPLSSFFLVPVYFGSDVIALLILGWVVPHVSRPDDAVLLDAVTQYLSAQLMSAINDMHEQHKQRLGRAALRLRDKLAAKAELDDSCVQEVRICIAEQLRSVVCPVHANGDGTTTAYLPREGIVELPYSLSDLAPEAGEGQRATIIPLDTSSKLRQWLHEHDEPYVGAYVDTGEYGFGLKSFLVLREHDQRSLDTAELDFLRRVVDDARLIFAGDAARSDERRMSQALMSGMRNQLQEVEGITAHGVYSSATADAFVGGDFYDLICLPNRQACAIMGDVSGKGVEAASVSAAVRTALGAYAWEGLSPAHMVRTLNNFLLGFSRLETFATLFVGIIDLKASTLMYCSAGHPPALLVRSDASVESLDVQSGVVGAFEGMFYREGSVQLHQGDTLLLYTDGVVEARATDGAFFGEEGLHDTVLTCAVQKSVTLADDVLLAVEAFTENNLDDDIAIVDITFSSLGNHQHS